MANPTSIQDYLPHLCLQFGEDDAEEMARTIFDRVADPVNWKNPVNGVAFSRMPSVGVALRFFAGVAEAIVHFTGSVPEVSTIQNDDGTFSIVAKAPGYYAAVGA